MVVGDGIVAGYGGLSPPDGHVGAGQSLPLMLTGNPREPVGQLRYAAVEGIPLMVVAEPFDRPFRRGVFRRSSYTSWRHASRPRWAQHRRRPAAPRRCPGPCSTNGLSAAAATRRGRAA